MKIQIKYPEQEFFAIVTDIDITSISSNEFNKLKKIVDTYGVTIIKNQPLNDEQQVSFSSRFGKLERPLEMDNSDGLLPEITRVSNVDMDGNLLPIKSEKVIYDRGNNYWHTDSSFKIIPAKFSILSSREIPKEGGGTEFADAEYAFKTWENMPRKYSLQKIKDAICEHSIVYSRMQNTGDIFDKKFKDDMPFVKQRLVRTHPYTKKNAFYAGSHCSHILDWGLEESRNLIKEINEWIVSAGIIAKHKWSEEEVVIWDNRRVLHRGTGFDEGKYRRIMHRTTVAGDLPSIEEKFELDFKHS